MPKLVTSPHNAMLRYLDQGVLQCAVTLAHLKPPARLFGLDCGARSRVQVVLRPQLATD